MRARAFCDRKAVVAAGIFVPLMGLGCEGDESGFLEDGFELEEVARYGWAAPDPEGRDHLTDGPPLTGEDREFGAGVLLGRLPDGTVIQTRARPGLWNEFAGLEVTEQGEPLIEDLEPPERREVEEGVVRIELDAATTGLAVLPEGRIVLSHSEVDRDAGDVTVFLTLFSEDREPLAQKEQDGGRGRYLHGSEATGRLLMPVDDPRPVVVAYEVK